VTYGRLGQEEIRDHAAVLKQLAAERPYMDPARAGIHGISYGGFLISGVCFWPPIYIRWGCRRRRSWTWPM